MPKVKRIVETVDQREEVRVTSVMLGLAMVIALIVTMAAWMGGSLPKMESRLANSADGLARAVGLAVQDVAVIGLENRPELAGKVRGAAMVEPGENMFRADPHRIRERIAATGEVVNIRVHRLWPDQVVIMAQPADLLGLWHDGSDWKLVDELGRVRAGRPDSPPPGLLHLAGSSAPEAAPQLVAGLSAHPDLSRRLRLAHRIGLRRWDLELSDGTLLRLPADGQMLAGLDSFARLQASHSLSGRALKTIDLRVPGRLVLAPRPAAPVNEGAA